MKKLDDWHVKHHTGEYWFYRQLDKRKTEGIRTETVFLVLRRERWFLYHSSITEGLIYVELVEDEYGYPIDIDYIMPDICK